MDTKHCFLTATPTALLITLLLTACSVEQRDAPALLSDAAYAQTVIDWRAERLDRLKSPNGWLTLAGLYWLGEGTTTFGAGTNNGFMFPNAQNARLGSFDLADGIVTMRVSDAADVRVDGKPVDVAILPDDSSGTLVLATHGSLAWSVIARDGKYAIRLRDYEHASLEALPPIPYFEVDRRWRVEATLKRYAQPRALRLGTVIEGLGWNPESPGVVEFEIDDERYSLEAYDSGEELFFIFGDSTTGKQTYGAGRYLYAAKPGKDGILVLDFNRAYNPPCVFNDFATCPVATPRNRLKVAIEAGEKYDKALYFGPTS